MWGRFHKLLSDIGVKIPRARLAKNDVCGVYEKSVRGYSFAGPACAKIQEPVVLDALLNIVYPASRRATLDDGRPNLTHKDFNLECFQGYKNAKSVWDKYQECWYELNVLGGDRKEKASQVRHLAFVFVEEFAKCYKRTTHLYPHLLVAHVPDQIENLPK